MTALLVYKGGYMTISEIKHTMDLYKKFTMKKIMPDNSVIPQSEALFISD